MSHSCFMYSPIDGQGLLPCRGDCKCRGDHRGAYVLSNQCCGYFRICSFYFKTSSDQDKMQMSFHITFLDNSLDINVMQKWLCIYRFKKTGSKLFKQIFLQVWECLMVHSAVIWNRERFLEKTAQPPGPHPLGVRNIISLTIVTAPPHTLPRATLAENHCLDSGSE